MDSSDDSELVMSFSSISHTFKEGITVPLDTCMLLSSFTWPVVSFSVGVKTFSFIPPGRVQIKFHFGRPLMQRGGLKW